MYDLLLLGIAAVYFAVVGLLLYKVKPYWSKALVLVAAVLIPNADDWYYRQQLADYCKNEAGFKVYEQVSRREGLVDQSTSKGDVYLQGTSFAYIEWPERIAGGGIEYWRADRLPDGSISKPYKISQYTAPYEILRLEKKIGPFTEVRQQVVQRAHGILIGEFIGFFYYGGWYPRALVGTGSLVAGCGEGGKTVLRSEWRIPESTAYKANANDRDKLTNNIFSKE